MALSRREFLAGAAAAAGAGLVLSGPAAASARILPRITRVREPGLAPATLTMWTNHPEWVQQVNAFVSEFERKNPAVKIQVTPKPGPSYPTLITSALAAGSAPDIFGFAPGGQYVQLAQAGHLHNLTGKIDIGALLPSATGAMYVGNKVYGLPLLGEYTTGIYYWKPIFQKYHLSIPTTWTEFTNLCRTIQSKGTVPALGMPSQDGELTTFFWTGMLTTVRGPAGVAAVANGTAKLTDPDFLAGTEYFQSLVPYFAPGYASTNYLTGKADFAEGKCAMLEGGSADYTGYKDVNPQVDLGFFAHPHSPDFGMSTVNSGIDYLYGLNSSVTNPDQIAAAVAFFNFFLTPAAGSQVAQTLELPDTKGARATQPMEEEVIKASANDAPEWYQYTQLTNMWNYSLLHITDMLLGSITVKQFVTGCQAQIK
jgi:raffinose/stachyose/melibiose transport system substrate-binding protein